MDMSGKMWGVKLAMLALGLLLLVPESTQLRVDHPLFSVVQKLNLEAGPFLGLIITGGRHERILKNSTYFTPHSSIPSLTFSGRTFNIGRFNGVPAIYVVAGAPLVNTGVTVQILVDSFRISGLISYGSAATVSNKVFIANVVVPSSVSYIGSWNWKKYDENAVRVFPSLIFGDYNLPQKGQNALASVELTPTPIYSQTGSNEEEAIDIKVDQEWLSIANQINYGERPTVVIGDNVKLGSSDVYVSNVAYANYLNSQLGVTAVDTESAAVVTTAIANALPSIVFRGTSNRPGSTSDERLSDVSANNVLKVVAKFVEAAYITPKKYSIV